MMTKEAFDRAVNNLRKDFSDQNYMYTFPNKTKKLVVYGKIAPWTAAKMATQVLDGEKKVEDFDCMIEKRPLEEE